MEKVFILHEEDLYAGCDCGNCSCWTPTVRVVRGVFTSKEKLNDWIDKKRRIAKEHNYPFRDDLYDIEEEFLDEEL
jgi:hypothetical protein